MAANGTHSDQPLLPGTADAGSGVASTSNGELKAGDWFTELSTMWPGQGLSIQVDEILFKQRSDFQVLGPAA